MKKFLIVFLMIFSVNIYSLDKICFGTFEHIIKMTDEEHIKYIKRGDRPFVSIYSVRSGKEYYTSFETTEEAARLYYELTFDLDSDKIFARIEEYINTHEWVSVYHHPFDMVCVGEKQEEE